MDWVPIPNRMDGLGYLTLLRHRHGVAHFGVWCALLQVASRCPVRGTLISGSGVVHTPSTLARMTLISPEVIATALRRLVEVGWIEVYDEICVAPKEVTREIPQEGAAIPQDAAPRARKTERNGMEHIQSSDYLQIDSWYRAALAEYPGAKTLPGSPDDVVVQKCMSLTNGDHDVMAAALRAMHFAGKHPNRSWMWFPAVLKGYIA